LSAKKIKKWRQSWSRLGSSHLLKNA